MSSILDALEKANRERAAREGRQGAAAGSAALGQESVRERRLREETESQRRTIRVMVGALLAFVLLTGAGSFVYFRLGSDSSAAPGAPPPGVNPPAELPEAAPPEAVPPTPTATPVPEPTATPQPTPTPWPSPTPWPTPTAAPTAPPATPTPAPTEAPAPRPAGYRGLFRDGQVIGVSDVGLRVEGLVEKDSGNIAVIDGQRVRAGQKLGDLHIVDIQPGVLTIDVGDAVVKARF